MRTKQELLPKPSKPQPQLIQTPTGTYIQYTTPDTEADPMSTPTTTTQRLIPVQSPSPKLFARPLHSHHQQQQQQFATISTGYFASQPPVEIANASLPSIIFLSQQQQSRLPTPTPRKSRAKPKSLQFQLPPLAVSQLPLTKSKITYSSKKSLQSQVSALDSKVSEIMEDLDLISMFIWSKFGGMDGFPEKFSAKYFQKQNTNQSLPEMKETQLQTKVELLDLEIPSQAVRATVPVFTSINTSMETEDLENEPIIEELSDPLAFSPNNEPETIPQQASTVTVPPKVLCDPSAIFAKKKLIQEQLELIKPCSVRLINITTFGIQSTNSCKNSNSDQPQIYNSTTEVASIQTSENSAQENNSSSNSNLEHGNINIPLVEPSTSRTSSNFQEFQPTNPTEIVNSAPVIVENPPNTTGNGENPKPKPRTRYFWKDAEQKHKCQLCPKSFPHKQHLRRHMRVHTGEKPFVCEFCGAGFTQGYTLVLHRMKHTGEKPFSCELCNARFIEPQQVRAHKAKEHPGQRPYVCQFCYKDFENINQRNACRETHLAGGNPQPYICDYCGKTFKTRGGIHKHRKAHTGDLPYECDLCGRRFHAGSLLKRHKISAHFPEQKSYIICDICGRPCGNMTQLNAHKESHIGLWESSVECTICGRRFKHEKKLSIHMLSHTGTRPFPCKICGKRFKLSNVKNLHERAHRGEYQCKLCGKLCTNPRSLRSHTRKKHPDPEKAKEIAEQLKRKEIKCEKCGRILKTPQGFRKHQESNNCRPPTNKKIGRPPKTSTARATDLPSSSDDLSRSRTISADESNSNNSNSNYTFGAGFGNEEDLFAGISGAAATGEILVLSPGSVVEFKVEEDLE